MKIVKTIKSSTLILIYEKNENIKDFYTDSNGNTFLKGDEITLRSSERRIYHKAFKYEI